VYRAAGTPDTQLHGGSVAAAGGSQPHENMPPFLVMRWCIALEGIFPPHPFAASTEPVAAPRRWSPRWTAR
jgi:microcystin-dependent protein